MKILFLILLFGVCYWKAYSTYEVLHRNFYCISVRIQDQAVTKKKLMKVEEMMLEQADNHIPELAAFHMTEHTKIVEQELGRSTQVTLYGVYGQMQQVTPSQLTAGNFVTSEDYAGCVIDEDSAFAIFGSTQVVGQSIEIDKKEYYIRGVIESEMPIVMIQEKAETAEFWNLELNYGNLLQGREYATQLMSNYGLSSDYILIEQNFIGDCIGNLLVLPVLVIVVVVFVSQWRRIHRNATMEGEKMKQKHYRTKRDWICYGLQIIRQSWCPLVLVAGSVAILIVTWQRFGTFPMRYLPSKWSDFNQHIRFYNEIKSHLRELSYVTPRRQEVLLKQNCMKCIFFSVSALFLEWHILDVVLLKKQGESNRGS